jgi:hypothetical protein
MALDIQSVVDKSLRLVMTQWVRHLATSLLKSSNNKIFSWSRFQKLSFPLASGRKLSDVERWQAAGMVIGGVSYRQTAERFNVSHSVIVRLKQRVNQAGM